MREELYHKNGLKAVQDNIKIFYISIEWEYNREKIVLTLPGNFSMVASNVKIQKTAELYEIRTDKNVSESGFRYALERFKRYV